MPDFEQPDFDQELQIIVKNAKKHLKAIDEMLDHPAIIRQPDHRSMLKDAELLFQRLIE